MPRDFEHLWGFGKGYTEGLISDFMEFVARLFHMIDAQGASLHTTDDVITTLRRRLIDCDQSLSAERETSSSLSKRVAATKEALAIEQRRGLRWRRLLRPFVLKSKLHQSELSRNSREVMLSRP